MKSDPVLYVVASGAEPTAELPTFIASGIGPEWDTCVITTPEGSRFFDTDQVAAMTGHPVRTHFKDPAEPDVLPPAQAFLAAPLTFNTVNKWAAGISDTLSLALLNEAIGLGLPIVAAPWVNSALARHPAFIENLAKLRDWGVRVVPDADSSKLNKPPGQPRFPWDNLHAELALLYERIRREP